jgi:Ca-activated chloride channel homolog
VRLGSAVCVAFVVSSALGGAAAQRGAPRLPLFRSAIDLTTVTVTVLDRNGALVTGLPRDAFEVYEDGERQPIALFTNERVPVSVSFLLDVSDSMYGRRIQESREATVHFLADLVARGDEYSIFAFNHQARLLTTWTSDPTTASSVLGPIRPFGATAIYDAISGALPLVTTRGRERAALVVVSDGVDTASDVALREVRSALLRSNAFVYAVAIDTADRRPINAPVQASALREITDPSGGRTEIAHGSSDVSRALEGIAQELSSQYLIGYGSPKPVDGQYHTIRVRVPGTDYRVRARAGYVAESHN